MKKSITLLLALILCVTLFAGCNGGDNSGDDNNGGNKAGTVTETYEHPQRNVTVSVTYPEGTYTLSETPFEDAKSDYTDMVIMGDKVNIELKFQKYSQADKSFEGLKEWFGSQLSFKSSYKELTVNKREAVYREYEDKVYMNINIEDVADTTRTDDVLNLAVAITPVNSGENAKDYFETAEVQSILNSIKVEKTDPNKPIKD